MTLSEKCRDFLCHKCEDAGCDCRHHVEDGVRQALGDYASRAYGIEPYYALELLSYLTTVHRAPEVPLFVPLETAAAAVKTALDIGWRPTFAQQKREQGMGRG